ncbi:MAG: HD domain-containing protein [Smithella sp.]
MHKQYYLKKSDLHDLREWFSQYVKSFYCSDTIIQKALVLKQEHTLKVCKEILNIGRKLDLSQNNLMIAEVMALFHDIGRFEQFIHYRTFVDKKSENHGELGVKILQQQKVLAALEEDTRELILKAILYHNRLLIPEDESPICIYFSRLLRDADKLDIFDLFSTYYYLDSSEKSSAVELDLPDVPEISEKVLHSLRQGSMVGIQHLRSVNDFKLLQMGWIYDINYPPTLRMIYERGYLQKIKDTLPSTEEIDSIYSSLMSYLQEKI